MNREPRTDVEMTDYERFEGASAQNRRLLRQEELILDVTEALCDALESEGVKRTELAQRLGKTKGFVSQLLSGSRNLTLRTIADVADALNCGIEISVRRPTLSGSHRIWESPRGGWSNMRINESPKPTLRLVASKRAGDRDGVAA